MSFIFSIICESIVMIFIMLLFYLIIDIIVGATLLLLSTLGLFELNLDSALLIVSLYKFIKEKRKKKKHKKNSQFALKKFLRVLKDNEKHKDAYPLFIKNFNDKDAQIFRMKHGYPVNMQSFFEALFDRYEGSYYLFIFMTAFNEENTKEGINYWREIEIIVEQKHLSK